MKIYASTSYSVISGPIPKPNSSQGARLTAFELVEDGLPGTLLLGWNPLLVGSIPQFTTCGDVWSTQSLDIAYCPFGSCQFLLHLFNASPVLFPWHVLLLLLRSFESCRFWFLVMIPDYFCRFLSWIPKSYLGSKESCRCPASQCLIVVLAQCQASMILPLSSLSHALSH